MKSPYGYTLIELLLVVAVLAVLSSLAIITYRHNADNNRIDQTALEMQHVLQAALAFNVAQNKWPADNATQPCVSSGSDSFITAYLPNANYTSHYGNNYCWATDTTDPSSTQSLFWVALKMPFTDLTRNYQMATQMAARLPDAVILQDPTKAANAANFCTAESANCYVRAEVALPAAQGSSGNGEVIGLGYCDPNATQATQPGSRADINCVQGYPKNHYTISFSCPLGETGQVYLIPNFYSAAALSQADPSTILTTIGARTDNGSTTTSCQADGTSSNFICPIVITALYDSESYSVVNPNDGANAGTIGATYIAYCAKPNVTNSKKEIIKW